MPKREQLIFFDNQDRGPKESKRPETRDRCREFWHKPGGGIHKRPRKIGRKVPKRKAKNGEKVSAEV